MPIFVFFLRRMDAYIQIDTSSIRHGQAVPKYAANSFFVRACFLKLAIDLYQSNLAISMGSGESI